MEQKGYPIRVLHVLGALNIGGAEMMVMNLYRNIDREKIQFDFVIHTTAQGDFTNEILKLGGKIYSCPRYIGRNHIQYCKWWNNFLEEHREYKIIHGHVRSTASLYMAIAKKKGCVTISHSHSTSNGEGISALAKNAMQYPIRHVADYLFACSDEAGEWLFGRKAIIRNNYRVIPNAIDMKRFAFNEQKRSEIREQLGIKKEDFVIGHVGRFTEPKNHIFLIDIFQRVKQKRQNTKLLLVGDGELKGKMKLETERLGVSDSVIFAGKKTDTEDYYQVMDAFAFPSLWEGLGIVVLEAQANGLGCIVSDGVPDKVKISESVQFLPLEEPEKWIEALEMSEGRKMKMQFDGREFDIKKIAFEMQGFYQEV